MLATFLNGTSEKLLGRSKCQLSGGVAPATKPVRDNGSDYKSETGGLVCAHGAAPRPASQSKGLTAGAANFLVVCCVEKHRCRQLRMRYSLDEIAPDPSEGAGN